MNISLSDVSSANNRFPSLPHTETHGQEQRNGRTEVGKQKDKSRETHGQKQRFRRIGAEKQTDRSRETDG